MNQITLQQATPRAGQSEALSDCIIEELRRYDEHLCDARGLAVGQTSRTGCQNPALPGARLACRLPERSVIMRPAKRAPAAHQQRLAPVS